MKFYKFIVVLMYSICSITNAAAQTPIKLKAATDTALKNNLLVKNEKLRAAYQQQLIGSAKTLPAANVFVETGQFNSIYVDTKLGFSQAISFPKVYTSQRNFLIAGWKASVLSVGIKEALLKKQVAQVYYTLLYLQQKRKLLQKNDTLFAEFLRKATLRFSKGESNILEKATAEFQRGQIGIQLSQLEQDIVLAQLQFQLLLNSEQAFTADETNFKIDFTYGADSILLQSHPVLQYLQQQQKVAAAFTNVEKAKLLPEISLGYNLTSIKGTGSNNKEYNSVPQFHSVQIGLGIPVFTSGQKARINAAKASEAIAANEFDIAFKEMQNSYQAALQRYKKYDVTVYYFENTALKNADLITTTANKQFINGDINYLEWVLLITQAVSIQSDYIEVLKNRNESVTEINSFIIK